jgi:hypothetical protein
VNQITRGTPIGPQRCVEVLRGIASAARDDRDNWSWNVDIWLTEGEVDPYESRMLAAVLGWAAVIETEIGDNTKQKRVRESLLDALSTIADSGGAPLDVLEAVSAAIPPHNRRFHELDFIEPIELEMHSLRAGQPQPPPPDTPARSPIGPEHAVLLVRGITSVWPFPRGQSAQAVTELCGTGRLDRREGDALSGVLGWAAVVETDVPEVRGLLLDSLGALAGAGLVEADTRAHLAAAIVPADLHPAERAAYGTIMTGLAGRDGIEP